MLMRPVIETDLFNRARIRHHKVLGGRLPDKNRILNQYVEQAFFDRLVCFHCDFHRMLVLGDVSHPFLLTLQERYPQAEIIQGSCSSLRAGSDPTSAPDVKADIAKVQHVLCEDDHLPFSDATFDLVFSSLTFHLLNTPQQALGEAYRLLRPGGLFLSSFLGGQTLYELRSLLLELELEATGGAAQRVSPMIDAQTGAFLLQNASFQEPVTESETVTISFPSLTHLRTFIKALGEQSPLLAPNRFLSKKTLLHLKKKYQESFPSKESGLLATFEILSYTGWKPSLSEGFNTNIESEA